MGPPLTDVRQARGGNRYEFFRPVRASDAIRATWRITDIVEREGGAMLIVSSETTYTDARSDDLLARNTETLIYQSLGSS